MAKYDEIRAQHIEGLDAAIMAVLAGHVGAGAAIGRRDLVAAVRERLGEKVHERKVREAIRDLRRRGAPICAVAGEGGGYYLAANMGELEDFFRREFLAKIDDMRETMRAMRDAARLVFREAV